jgi:hypothetical protein
MNIDISLARKVLEIVDAGLDQGVGVPEPGFMCVEAAVCYALGEPHGDNPSCVDQTIRSLKIQLNDSCWSSKDTRAKGLRKLAILQLGTKDNFNAIEFSERLVPLANEMAERAKKVMDANPHIPGVRRDAIAAATLASDVANAAAFIGIRYASRDIAVAAAIRSAARCANAAATAVIFAGYGYLGISKEADTELFYFSEKVSDILIDMKVPGVEFLSLLDE